MNGQDHEDGSPRPPTFSQKNGYTDYPTAIQHQSLNRRTRVDLWNFIEPYFVTQPASNRRLLVSPSKVWVGHLQQIGSEYSDRKYRTMMQDIVLNGEWFEVYDLLQALVEPAAAMGYGRITKLLNDVLALNRAGCRVVGTFVTEITEKAEVDAVAHAVESSAAEAQLHIKNALALLAARDNPQWAKSISESISAAEAAARELSGQPKASFGEALTSYSRSGSPAFHPALIKGWKEIYGFTSDDGGIRHALQAGTLAPSQDLAQYFVVTCSAFVSLATTILASKNTADEG